MPRWMAALFAVIMLGVCVITAFCTVSRIDLAFRLADTSLMLDTSRQRERKQQYEYDQVAAELPEVQAQVAERTPLADAAKAQETDLRAQRKQLRAEEKQLTGDLSAANADLEQLRDEAARQAQALRAEIDQAAALLKQVADPPAPANENE